MIRQVKFTIIFLGTLLYPVICFGQSAGIIPRKYTGLQVGISHVQIRDQSLNNALHSGFGLNVNYFMEKSVRNRINKLDVGLKGSLLTTSFESEFSSFHFQLPLSYRFLFSIPTSDNNSRFYAGGISKILFNIEYFDNWDENHFHWLTSYSIGAAIRAEFPIFQASRLIFEGSLSLISLNSSTPKYFEYTQENSGFLNVISRMHKNSRIGHIGNYLAPELEIRYLIRRTKRYFPQLVWQMQYINYHRIKGVSTHYMHQTFGVEIHF